MKSKNQFLVSFLLFVSTSVYCQCFMHGGGGNVGEQYKSSGNSYIDNKFNASKTDLEDVFNITVDLYLYNDSGSPNALAACTDDHDYYHGIVAFGLSMMTDRLWNANKGEYALAGVLAHEFAHILQCKKGYTSGNTRDRELHADFLAGYYFGRRSYLSHGLRQFASDLFSIGDYNFWSPGHHGTPNQRVNAMIAGYNSANLSISSAFNAGKRYVNGETSVSYRTCSKCDGHGKVLVYKTCQSCNGYGKHRCRNCRGNGGFQRSGYNAYGQYITWVEPCYSCDGNGFHWCNSCNGNGEYQKAVRCSRCSGKGKVKD